MTDWLDESEIARVLSVPKHIDQNIQWKTHGGYKTFSTDVVSEEADYEMILVGSLTEATGYVKFNLFVGSQPIAMLHVGKIHHNPDCERLEGKVHKHRWSDAYREKRAYLPNDIDVTTIESGFRSFLNECNIELRGRFVAPQLQVRLL